MQYLYYTTVYCYNMISLPQCVAHVEATIDFGEDENIEEGLVDQGNNNIAVM